MKTFFTILTSRALQTIASSLALEANLAWWRTNFSIFLSNPISFKLLLSKEVKIVTPTNLILPAFFLAAFNACRPELIWIVK